MRLAFPNGEHEDVAIGKGSFTIGTGDGDDVLLSATGVQPGHAVILVDQRGITLRIEDQSGDVTLNGRSIREKAILRLGDELSFNGEVIQLRADDNRLRPAPANVEIKEAVGTSPAAVQLRGVSGDNFGCAFPLTSELRIGSSEDCDIRLPGDHQDVSNLQTDGESVYLRCNDDDATVIVNGLKTHNAELQPGDQIAINGERFVVEAAGFVPAKAYAGIAGESEGSSTQVFSAPVIDAPDSKEKDGSGEESSASESEQEALSPTAEPTEGKARNRMSKGEVIIISACLILSMTALIVLYMSTNLG